MWVSLQMKDPKYLGVRCPCWETPIHRSIVQIEFTSQGKGILASPGDPNSQM